MMIEAIVDANNLERDGEIEAAIDLVHQEFSHLFDSGQFDAANNILNAIIRDRDKFETNVLYSILICANRGKHKLPSFFIFEESMEYLFAERRVSISNVKKPEEW